LSYGIIKMSAALLGLIIAALSVVAAILIGIPQVWFARRQTRIAEQAHALAIRSHVDVLARIRANKSARVGFVHYPPFVVATGDDHDQPTGLYVDLIRDFLKREDIISDFQQVRFSSAVQAIVDDEYDVVLSIFQTPRRSRFVDFSAFMHSVSVSGVVRRQEDRIHSQSDLVDHNLIFVVCREEIGHEYLEDLLKIAKTRIKVLDTSNVADIIQLVASKSADIAIADSLSCQHGLAARGAEGPKLKPVLRRHPLYLCLNGVMIGRNQKPLGDWLDKGLKKLLAEPEYERAESSILDEYHGIISKL
jgi:ABC-type amino acid transport substrate-binding protein